RVDTTSSAFASEPGLATGTTTQPLVYDLVIAEIAWPNPGRVRRARRKVGLDPARRSCPFLSAALFPPRPPGGGRGPEGGVRGPRRSATRAERSRPAFSTSQPQLFTVPGRSLRPRRIRPRLTLPGSGHRIEI